MSSPLLTALHAAPGPHPLLAELRAYAAGEVAGPAAQHLEAHTLACPRCADLLEGLQLTDAPATDRALAALRQRLRQRVGELERQPAGSALSGRRVGAAWPRIAAAAALVAGLGAGIWAWQEHRQTEPKTTLAVVRPAPSAYNAPVAAAAAERAESASAAVPEAVATAPAARPAIVAAVPRRPASSYLQRRPQPSAGSPITDNPALKDAEVVSVAPSAPADKAVAAARASAPIQPDSGRLSKAAAAGYAAAPVARKAAQPKTAAPADAAAQFPADTALPPGTVGMFPSAAVEAARRRVALPPPPMLEPLPKGGYQALREYLRKEAAEFEPETSSQPMKGTVRVRITISAAGRPETDSAKVLRSLRADYDAEVLRMLAEGPAWVPGVAKGRRAPLPVQVEVLFE